MITLLVRGLLKVLPTALAVAVVFTVWQVPEVRLPVVGWLLWTAVCWRPLAERDR